MDTELLSKETEARKDAEKKAGTTRKVKPAQVQTIPKPKGSPGDGYNLRREMGLDDEPQQHPVWNVTDGA